MKWYFRLLFGLLGILTLAVAGLLINTELRSKEFKASWPRVLELRIVQSREEKPHSYKPCYLFGTEFRMLGEPVHFPLQRVFVEPDNGEGFGIGLQFAESGESGLTEFSKKHIGHRLAVMVLDKMIGEVLITEALTGPILIRGAYGFNREDLSRYLPPLEFHLKNPES